ncbi:MAG: glycine oxidase ThiO [Steroidobacteraceae bacterium]
MREAAPMQVTILGGGIAGLACGVELAERAVRVELLERQSELGAGSCSWCAGGMLAPWCELEDAAEPLIAELGLESLAWWRARFPGTHQGGTLVLAAGRDLPELTRFAQRTRQYRRLDRDQIAQLEPDLADRFEHALHFPDECHLDPRQALPFLAARLRALGGTIRCGADVDDLAAVAGTVVDCRGLGARAALPDLRGVRGEMLLLRSRELKLQRPVRLLHPRQPLYVVPRGDGVYMVGATMIENDGTGAVTARSVLELLTAAYALHPAFGEAQVLELGAQARPAFADNLPRIRRVGASLHVNGLYRHGFLLAPALAVRVAQVLLNGRYYPELMHENHAQRRLA